MKNHKLHNHPILEQALNISKDKVIVDIEFRSMFSCFEIDSKLDLDHIIIDKYEFEKILKIKL